MIFGFRTIQSWICFEAILDLLLSLHIFQSVSDASWNPIVYIHEIFMFASSRPIFERNITTTCFWGEIYEKMTPIRMIVYPTNHWENMPENIIPTIINMSSSPFIEGKYKKKSCSQCSHPTEFFEYRLYKRTSRGPPTNTNWEKFTSKIITYPGNFWPISGERDILMKWTVVPKFQSAELSIVVFISVLQGISRPTLLYHS